MRIGSVAALLAALFAPSTAHAQAIAPVVGTDLAARRVWLGVGWDPTLTTDLGGSLEPLAPLTDFRLFADAAFRAPVVLLSGLDDWQLALGATFVFGTGKGLGATLGVHPDVRLANDTTGSKVALGAALGVRPGYYVKNWSVAFDALWSMALATHMAHSNAVKDLFEERYPSGARGQGPHDGWYAFSSHRVHLGVSAGVAPARAIALHVSAGFAYTPQVAGILANPPIGPMPFFANLGGAYRW